MEFINFQLNASRLDTLLYNVMANNPAWKDLWKVVTFYGCLFSSLCVKTDKRFENIQYFMLPDAFFLILILLLYLLLISQLVRVLLLLSHGQASLERGFSINTEALSDNRSQRTLVAKRFVKDHIASCGGDVTDVDLSAPLLSAGASG